MPAKRGALGTLKSPGHTFTQLLLGHSTKLPVSTNPPLSHHNPLSNHVPTKMSTNYLISSFPFSDHFISSPVWVLFLTDDLIPALLDSETVLESQASLSQGLWLGFTPLVCHTLGYLK